MAQEDNYKEGVDFEMVLSKNQPKGGTNKTRRFFTKKEKEAMKAPKAAAPASKAKPKPIRPQKRPVDLIDATPIAPEPKITVRTLGLPVNPRAAFPPSSVVVDRINKGNAYMNAGKPPVTPLKTVEGFKANALKKAKGGMVRGAGCAIRGIKTAKQY